MAGSGLQVFHSVLEVMPDCNRRFLAEIVQGMFKQYDEVQTKQRRFLIVPSLPSNFSENLEKDAEFDGKDLENMKLSDTSVLEMVQLVVEQLLMTPNYPKHFVRRAFSALENRQPKPANEDQSNNLLPIAAGGDRPVTADPGLMPAVAASSSNTNISPSPSCPDISIDDPNYMPQLYNEEAVQLLTNEFRWLFVNAVKSALKLHKGEYTATRDFLLDIIGPYLVGDDVNIGAVDPVLPQYPRRIDAALVKTKERTHLIKGENKFELLKQVRKVAAAPINVTHPRLATELAKIRTQKSKSDPITCLICEDETTVDTLVTCVEGHIYCHTCLIDYVKAKIQDGVKQGYLECMQQECSAPFSQHVLAQRLPNDLLEQLDERIAMANLNQANIADLVRCPKCQMVFELDAGVQVLECVVCKHASCRQCHQPWNDGHKGKKCEELETMDETKIRQLFEERMTAELVRLCPKCRTPLVKNEGCNKMTCSCKATLCYVCREPFIDYEHFCRHPRNPGQPCDQCVKCSLWIDPAAEDAARIKRIDEEAKAALERQKAARLNAAGGSGLKKQTTSDPVEIVNLALSSLALSVKPSSSQPPPPPKVQPVAAAAVGPNLAQAGGILNMVLPAFIPPRANPEQDENAAIFGAVERNDLAAIERLVEWRGPGILNQVHYRNREGPLHRAVMLGHFEVVRTLLRLGANVNAVDVDRQTPLHVAVMKNDPRIVRKLIRRGANLNATANDNMTPLYFAARYGKTESARLLIDSGADLEFRDSNFRQTPLHCAAHHNRAEIAEMLIAKGANIQAHDFKTGGTPLHNAARSGAVATVNVLLRHGAPVNAMNNARRTPLHQCAFRGPGNLDTARLLIQAGADLYARDVTGRSVSATASMAFKFDIFRAIQYAL